MSELIARFRRSFIGREPIVFFVVLVVVTGVWGFVEIFGEVREGDTERFDAEVLRFFRDDADPHKLAGPAWVETSIRDITALGGVVVLALLTAVAAGFLILVRRYHMMWFVLASVCGAGLLNTSLKYFVARPRPQIVPQLTDVTSASFPSGHSALSAAVYLTLGALLTQTVVSRRIKLYFLSVALLLTLMVGLSRVMLGVHYPTDVLAGWTTGLVWALLCWLAARYLQRHGAVEQAEDPLPVDPPQPATGH